MFPDAAEKRQKTHEKRKVPARKKVVGGVVSQGGEWAHPSPPAALLLLRVDRVVRATRRLEYTWYQLGALEP